MAAISVLHKTGFALILYCLPGRERRRAGLFQPCTPASCTCLNSFPLFGVMTVEESGQILGGTSRLLVLMARSHLSLNAEAVFGWEEGGGGACFSALTLWGSTNCQYLTHEDRWFHRSSKVVGLAIIGQDMSKGSCRRSLTRLLWLPVQRRPQRSSSRRVPQPLVFWASLSTTAEPELPSSYFSSAVKHFPFLAGPPSTCSQPSLSLVLLYFSCQAGFFPGNVSV